MWLQWADKKSHVCHMKISHMYVTCKSEVMCMSHANYKHTTYIHLRVNLDPDLVMYVCEYGYLHLGLRNYIHIPSIADLLTFIINTH